MPAVLANPASATTSLDRSDGSAVEALSRAALGPVHPDYYLPVFARFESAGRASPSWNWAACLCTFNWMLFRQLWGAALVYAGAVAGLALVLFGFARLVMDFSETARLCLLVALATLAFIAPGVWGNAILYLHTRQTMESALADTATVSEACVLLNRKASSRQRMVWLALLNAVLAGVAIAAVIVLPDAERPLAGRVATEAPAPAGLASAPPAPAPATPAPAALAAQIRATTSAPTAPASASPVAATVPASAPAAAGPAASVHATAPAQASSSNPALPPSSISAALPDPKPASAPASAPVVSVASKLVASTPMAKASAPAAKPTSAPRSTPPEAMQPGFYINVGLFAQDSNAQKAHAKLRDADLPALTQELDTANGKRTRVRAGPFDTQLDANAAAKKIRGLGLEAVVFKQ